MMFSVLVAVLLGFSPLSVSHSSVSSPGFSALSVLSPVTVTAMDDCDSALFSMIATAAAFSDAASNYNSLNSTYQANVTLWNDPSFPLYHDHDLGVELQIAAINVEDAQDYMMGAGLAAEGAATSYAHCY